MDNFSVTMVTMAFDLESLENAPRRRSFDFYKNEGVHLMKSGLPLVIFTANNLVPWIEEKRKDFGAEDRIKIVTVDPYQLISRFPRIQEILLKIPGVMDTEKPHTPLYTAITWSKFTFLDRVIIENPFSTTHFCWIDFGLTHIAKYHMYRPLQIIVETMWSHEDYVDKIHVNIPAVLDWKSIEVEPHEYWFHFTSGVAGGIFGGSGESIRDLCSKFWKLAYQKLDDGYAPLEQNVLAYIISKNVEKFQPWFGRYDDIGINWGGIHVFSPYLVDIVDQARTHGYINRDNTDPNLLLGEELARQLLEGHKLGRYHLHPEHRMKMLNEMFMCRWYRSPDSERVKRTTPIGKEILKWYNEDQECQQEILELEQMFIENLSFVNLTLPPISE